MGVFMTHIIKIRSCHYKRDIDSMYSIPKTLLTLLIMLVKQSMVTQRWDNHGFIKTDM
jgi:hypothetical protein